MDLEVKGENWDQKVRTSANIAHPTPEQHKLVIERNLYTPPAVARRSLTASQVLEPLKLDL